MDGSTSPQAAVAPGWYYAPGDPPGTVRRWDGTRWIGGPTHQFAPTSHIVAPRSTSFQPLIAGTVPAEIGPRAIAMAIDSMFSFFWMWLAWNLVPNLVDLDDFDLAVVIATAVMSVIPLTANNVMQAITGQSFGKRVTKTRLVKLEDGQPLKWKMALRLLIPLLLSLLSCGVYGIIDYVRPIGGSSNNGQRQTDVWIKTTVIEA